MDKKEAVAEIAGWTMFCLLSTIIAFYATREFIRECFSSKKEE